MYLLVGGFEILADILGEGWLLFSLEMEGLDHSWNYGTGIFRGCQVLALWENLPWLEIVQKALLSVSLQILLKPTPTPPPVIDHFVSCILKRWFNPHSVNFFFKYWIVTLQCELMHSVPYILYIYWLIIFRSYDDLTTANSLVNHERSLQVHAIHANSWRDETTK